MEENAYVQCSLVDALLHTYRLFSTAEQVLLTADRRQAYIFQIVLSLVDSGIFVILILYPSMRSSKK